MNNTEALLWSPNSHETVWKRTRRFYSTIYIWCWNFLQLKEMFAKQHRFSQGQMLRWNCSEYSLYIKVFLKRPVHQVLESRSMLINSLSDTVRGSANAGSHVAILSILQSTSLFLTKFCTNCYKLTADYFSCHCSGMLWQIFLVLSCVHIRLPLCRRRTERGFLGKAAI